jgi:hypothetical protein
MKFLRMLSILQSWRKKLCVVSTAENSFYILQPSNLFYKSHSGEKGTYVDTFQELILLNFTLNIDIRHPS